MSENYEDGYITIKRDMYQDNEKNKFCINCGCKGHILKDCKNPITSFGIIAYKISYKNDKLDASPEIRDVLDKLKATTLDVPVIKFLFIQRKDTMGYIDLMRGKYPENIDEKNRLMKIYINEMTVQEKIKIKGMSFDDQWKVLWNSTSKSYINEYKNAKRKFDLLDLEKLIPNTESDYTFSEISFPKGRKNMREQNINCAQREFYEETGYRYNDYILIKNYKPVEELFIGTNNVEYKHVYYLSKFKSDIYPPILDSFNKLQASEVKSINWLSYDEAMVLIRPYDTAKKNVLTQVYNDIKNYINKPLLSEAVISFNNSKEYLIDSDLF
jgi:ADP-ribose pyrophosphatase YjhB (NUDIX family)